MKDYLPLIAKIKILFDEFGDKFQPPATELEIADMEKWAMSDLKYKVDKDYITFLKSINGLDWNGFLIYASKISPYIDRPKSRISGFVETNLQLWEVEHARQFIYFGETGHSLYTYDTKTKLFSSNDRASLDVYATHESFSDMLYSVLETSLL